MTATTEAVSVAGNDHVVMFYEHDDVLAACVAGFAREGLAAQADVLIVATAAHRQVVTRHLQASAQPETARLTLLDAQETLNGLLVGGRVDSHRLHDLVSGWLTETKGTEAPPRIYGEMVALLWADGQHGCALQLEDLWNGLTSSSRFRLLCGYPLQGFDDETSPAHFSDVCLKHTAVTTESYARLQSDAAGNHPMVVLDNTEPGGRILPV